MTDAMHPMDRDCLVAAILATSVRRREEAAGEVTVTERFTQVLNELQKRGGTGEMWSKAKTASKG